MKTIAAMGISLALAAQAGAGPDQSAAALALSSTYASIENTGNNVTQSVFGGGTRDIQLQYSLPIAQAPPDQVRGNLYQLSSTTIAPYSQTIEKRLNPPARRPLSTTVPVDLPAVRGQTRFRIEWRNTAHELLGQTDIQVYPTNLLHELTVTLAPDALGVLDPNENLLPALRRDGVRCINLAETTLENFHGKLAIVGSPNSAAAIRPGFVDALRKLARRGTAVIWLQPPADSPSICEPSYYLVPEGAGNIAIVQPDWIQSLSTRPEAQLRLVYLCQLALQPKPFSIPNFVDQP